MGFTRSYPIDKIYTRNISEKYFYIIPYKNTFDNIDLYEISKMFLNNTELSEEDYEIGLEYGFLCEYKGSEVNRFLFTEVSKKKSGSNYMHIDAGKYICIKSRQMGIEKATNTFSEHLHGIKNFIAIETEIFSGKVNINNPINEIRLLIK